MRVVAVIPAKKTSTRIQGKNLIDLGGIPLVEWTLRASYGLFADVVVSTDSKEIGKLAKKYDAIVVKHPSGDPGATNVTIEALAAIDKTKYDAVFMLQPTSPFRSANSIRNALYEFRTAKDDHALAVFGVVDAGKRCTFHDIGVTYKGRQFLVPQFIDTAENSPNSYRVNGAIFGTTINNLLLKKAFIKDIWSVPVLMDALESLEIDLPADLVLARAVAKGLATNDNKGD